MGVISATSRYSIVLLLVASKAHNKFMARTLRDQAVSGAAYERTGVHVRNVGIAFLWRNSSNVSGQAPVKNRLFTMLTSRVAGCLSADCSKEGRAPRCVAKKGKHHAGMEKQEEHRNVGCCGVTRRRVHPE